MKKRILFSGIYVLLIIGIILGSLFDYQINSFLFSKNNVFGLIVAGVSEWPTLLSVAFIGGFVFGFVSTKDYKKIIKILSLIMMIACAIYSSIYVGKVLKSPNSFGVFTDFFDPAYIYIPIGIIITCPMLIPGYIVGKKCQDKKVLYVLLVLFCVYGVGELIILGVKALANRPRFRLVYEVGEDLFRNFWQPFGDYKEFIANNPQLNITKEEFRSFPSGHTSSAASMVYILGFLPVVFSKLKKYQPYLFAIGIIWMMFVAFTRMLVGAHYLTDVCFGALVQLVPFAVGFIIIKKKILKE